MRENRMNQPQWVFYTAPKKTPAEKGRAIESVNYNVFGALIVVVG